MPVHDGDPIGQSPGHGQRRDIRTPHRVGTVDLPVSPQRRVDPMGPVGRAGFLTRIRGPASPPSHQTLNPLAVDRQPRLIEQGIPDPPGSIKRKTKTHLINPPQRPFRFSCSLGAIIDAGAADGHNPALPADRHTMNRINLGLALCRTHGSSTLAKKSFSRVNAPTFACHALTSASCPLRWSAPDSNRLTMLSLSGFRQV